LPTSTAWRSSAWRIWGLPAAKGSRGRPASITTIFSASSFDTFPFCRTSISVAMRGSIKEQLGLGWPASYTSKLPILNSQNIICIKRQSMRGPNAPTTKPAKGQQMRAIFG
jgi:hypothetical protein